MDQALVPVDPSVMDQALEPASGSVSGSVDTNPGPAIPPNDETAFSSTPQFPKDQVNLVKLELVNLVLEIGAPLHSFHKIAQWAARANSCGHIFKPNDCPHYKTYLKTSLKDSNLRVLATQWKTCLFHGVVVAQFQQ
jgi:hypothetical protein